MKTNAVKTYVVYVSEKFPAYHPKAGELTLFATAIGNALENRAYVNIHHNGESLVCDKKKIHTIRKNYEEWKRKETEINEGRAVLSIRQWNGTRYQKGATWTEIARLEKIGVQKAEFKDDMLSDWEIDEEIIDSLLSNISKNDGLSNSDMIAWFVDGDYKPNEPLAIIHFTDFKY
ncbi:MAG: hypothetical protein WCJ03_07205 [Bacteroidales bacterium]